MGLSVTSGGDFKPCPEYLGFAVLVDITEPKMMTSQYGERLTFKFVFEIDLKQDDGTPYAVWSAPMGLSYSPRSNLKKFLDKWLKRDLTIEEKSDLDKLIGIPATISVVHEEHEGKTFANIAMCVPCKEQFRPSGLFVRQKDRVQQNQVNTGKSSSTQPAPSGSARNDYQSFGGEASKPTWQAYKIELPGNLAGQALGDLPQDKLNALVNKWLLPMSEKIKSGHNCKAWETRMINALNSYIASTESQESESPADEIPMDF